MKIIDYVDISPAVGDTYSLVTVPASLDGYSTAIVMFRDADGECNLGFQDSLATVVRPTGAAISHTTGQGTAVGMSYVPIDGNRQFEIKRNNADVECYLIGGFTSAEAVTFSTGWDGNFINPVATDLTAENIDITSYLGGDTAIAAIVKVQGAANGSKFRYGYDLVSESTSRLFTHQNTTILVPVESGQVRLARDRAEVTFQMLGYVKSGIRLNTTRSATTDTNNVFTAVNVPDILAEEDIVVAACGDSFASPSSIREVGQIWGVSTSNSKWMQAPLRLDSNRQVELYSDFTSSFVPEWFATNDTGGAVTYSITDIDGDNSVRAGQDGVVITMSAS